MREPCCLCEWQMTGIGCNLTMQQIRLRAFRTQLLLVGAWGAGVQKIAVILLVVEPR